MIIIISFRLTFLRRERRCFPEVWTAFYLPLQTWFTGNAGLPTGSCVPFALLPSQALWDVGDVLAAEGLTGLPSTTWTLRNSVIFLATGICEYCDEKVTIFAVPGLCGAQRPLHYIKRLYVNERLKRPLGYSPVKSKVLFSGRSHVNMSLRRFRLGGGRVPFFFPLWEPMRSAASSATAFQETSHHIHL